MSIESYSKFKLKLKAINDALAKGERSGKPIKFDNEKFKERMLIKYSNRMKA